VLDPSGRYALVANLGTDRIFVHPFDRAARKFDAGATAPGSDYIATPGSGPRHLAFDPSGEFLFAVNELTAEIQSFRWTAQKGQLTLIQTQSTNSEGFSGASSIAEVLVSADGRFVYASNRGEHTVLVYGLDRRTGKLALLQRVAAGGEVPWSIALHPSGLWLLVANERTNGVAVFRVDPKTGLISATGVSLSVPKPVSLSFFPGK
jgi:6-phosphogluconolactonase